MAAENPPNYQQWRHFLSSLKKSKNTSSPENQKDVFLGSTECLSTDLIRKLLRKSGKEIETELPKSSLKKLETSCTSYDPNQVKAKKGMATTSNIDVMMEEKADDKVSERQVEAKKGMATTSNIDVTMEEKADDKVSERQVKAKKGMATTSNIDVTMEEKADDKVSERQVKAKKGMATTSNKDVTMQEKSDDKVHTVLPAAAISEINETIETDRVRQRYSNKNKPKEDIDIPSSDWTLKMLSNYLNFEQTVDKIQQNLDPGVSQDIIERTVQEALRQIESVQQVIFAPCKSSAGHRKPKLGSDDIYDLSNITGRETDVRILLDAVLIPFAKEMQLKIETEKNYKNNIHPNCQFDYQIRSENDVVGLVEAKGRIHGNGIGPEAIVQGILQLSALQTEVYKRMEEKKKEVVPLRFFNIISDGYQFIFIQLDHKKILFDHQSGNGNEVPTIRCYVMDSREAIKEILVKMFGLLKAVI